MGNLSKMMVRAAAGRPTGGLSYADEVNADSPLGAWLLQGDATAEVGTDGTNVGATFGTGNGPGTGLPDAAVFDGAADYINLGSQSPDTGPGNAWTYEAWVWFDVGTGSEKPVVSQEIEGGNFAPALLRGAYGWNEDEAGCQYRQSSSRRDVKTTVVVDQWYHMVVVHTGTEMRLYMDATSVATLTNSGSQNDLNELHIANTPGRSWYLDGRVAGVAVYDTALSAARITAHYDAGV